MTYRPVSNTSIRDLNIEVYIVPSSNIVEVTFHTNQEASIISSSLFSGEEVFQLKCKIGDWHKALGHDFVFGILADSTDADLSIISPYDSGESRFTPDTIHEYHNNFAVIEFATTRALSEKALMRTAEAKIKKYSIPVANRMIKRGILTGSRSFVKMGVLVVSTDIVVSSEYLDDEIITELCLRKKAADAISFKMNELGFTTEPEDKLEDLRAVKTTLESIKLKFGSEPNMMLKEDYDHLYDETDYNYIAETFTKAWTETKKDLTTSDHDKELSDYFNKCSNGPRRDHAKRVVNYPIFLAKTKQGIAIEQHHGTLGLNAMERLINSCFTTCETAEENLSSLLERADLPFEAAKPLEEASKPTRVKFNRCNPKISESDKQEIARHGPGAKKYDDKLKDYLLEKKKALNYNVDLSDIDSDIDSLGTEFIKTSGLTVDFIDEVHTLFSKAFSFHSVSSIESLKEFSAITKTVGFHASLILSSIGLELAVSNIQHTRSGTYILKKLRYFDVYLLIKPTKSSSHLFYSIIVPEKSFIKTISKSCRQFTLSGGLYYTDFNSVDTSRINNVVNVASNYIVMFCDLARWSRINLDSLSKPSSITDELFLKHLAFRFLVHCENKSCTEESITNWRYVIMNLISITPNPKFTVRAFCKHDTVFRSRLQIWTQKRQLSAMTSMLAKRPYIEKGTVMNEDESREIARNVIDYISLTRLKDFSSIIETFYIGYEVDKNNISWSNSDGKLVEKIIAEEMKYDNVRHEHEGRTDIHDSPRPHEFSISYVRAISDVIGQSLEDTLGKDWQERISDCILSDIAAMTSDDLATLKASSNLQPQHFKATTKTALPRSKMAEKVLKDITSVPDADSRNPPFESIHRHLSTLETSYDGLLIDIFKKPQHAGIREIYVMCYEARFVQVFIERISRTLSLYIDCETMSKPNNKTRIPRDHYQRSLPKLKSREADLLYSSDDKQRWNQRIPVKAMCIMLCRLLPPYFHGFIIRTLNLWPKKKILLPTGVQTFLMNMSNYSDVQNPVKDALGDLFINGTKGDILSAGERVLNIKTGMMQGILHFLSSLYHCGFLLLQKMLATSAISKVPIVKGILISHICSSDDSSTMVTTDCSGDLKTARYLNLLILYSMRKLCVYLSLYPSPKSASGTHDLVEFNSTWTIAGSIVKATNKWSMASTVIPTGSSLIARQEHFSNLLTQLLESGGSIKQCSITQLAQGLLHYQLLGLTVHSLFSVFKTRLMLIPDPNVGFFLLDDPVCAGVMGFDYNNFMAITSNKTLNSRMAEQLNNEFVEVTQFGTMSTTATIRFGSLQKYRKFLKNCTPELDWRDFINKNPEMLYRKAKTTNEEIAKIMKKITAPGVSDSFSNSLAPIRAVAASVYMISHHSVCKRLSKSTTLVDADTIKTEQQDTFAKEKYSLLQLSNKLPGQSSLSEEQLNWIFPSQYIYNNIKEFCKRFRQSHVAIDWVTTIKGSATLIIPKVDFDQYTSLLSLCKWKWFGFDLHLHEPTLDKSWLKAKESIAWLKDTVEETLETSPFDDHCELNDYLTKIRKKDRRVNIISAPIRGRSTETTLLQLVKRNQWPKVLFKEMSSMEPIRTESAQKAAPLSIELSKIASKLYLMSLLPLTSEEFTFETKAICNQARDITWSDIRDLNSRLASLAFFIIVMRNPNITFNPESYFVLESIKGFVVGGYTKRQKYSRQGRKRSYTGEGVWVGSINGIITRLHIDDNFITEIETVSPLDLAKNVYLLNTLLKEIGVTDLQSNFPSKKGAFSYDMKSICLNSEDSDNVRVNMIQSGSIINYNITKMTVNYDHKIRNLRILSKLSDIGHNTVVTVLNYKPHFEDFILENVNGFEQVASLKTAWIDQRPLKPNYFFKFLEMIRIWIGRQGCSREESRTLNKIQNTFDESIRQWLKEVLMRCLRQRGIGMSIELAKSNITEASFEFPGLENVSDHFNLSGYDYLAGQEEIMGLLPDLEEGEDPSDLAGFSLGADIWASEATRSDFVHDNVASKKKEICSISAIHPALRSLPEDSQLSPAWWKLTIQGKITDVAPEKAALIQWLIGIEGRTMTEEEDLDESFVM